MAYTDGISNAYEGGSIKKKQNSDGTVTRYYGTATPTSATSSTGTTKKTGSSGGTGAVTAAVGGYAYPQQDTSYLDAIRSIYEEQLAAQKAARQEAYNTSVAQQRKNYDYAVGQVNSAADKSLQEAYRNKMLSLRTLPQALAAQGLNGGASESTTAGMLNNYGNSRNSIETGRNDNISDLGNTLSNNLASASQILQSGIANDYSTYATNLANMLAANIPTYVSTVQGTGATGTGGAATTAYNAATGTTGGTNTSNIISSLQAAGYTTAQIQQMLAGMG